MQFQNCASREAQLTWNFTFPIWKCVQSFSSNGFKPCMTRLLRKRSSKFSWNNKHTPLVMYLCCIVLESIPAYYCHVPYCSHIDQGQFDHSATEHCSYSLAGTAPGLTAIELASCHLLQESNKKRQNVPSVYFNTTYSNIFKCSRLFWTRCWMERPVGSVQS
jgi:hypothetical protein